jgi:hypothetical protein
MSDPKEVADLVRRLKARGTKLGSDEPEGKVSINGPELLHLATTLQSLSADLERVTAERVDKADAWDAIATKNAALKAAEARISTLTEALAPFAVLANDYMTDTANIEDDVLMAGRMVRRGEEGTPPRVTFGDYRKAHLAFKLAGGFDSALPTQGEQPRSNQGGE